jgi:hypothetical protein
MKKQKRNNIKFKIMRKEEGKYGLRDEEQHNTDRENGSGKE